MLKWLWRKEEEEEVDLGEVEGALEGRDRVETQ